MVFDTFLIKDIALQISIYVPLMWLFVMLFFLKRNNSNKYLLILFANITFVYLMTYNSLTGNYKFFADFSPLQGFASLNAFPLFYLYIVSLVKIKPIKFKNNIQHFILPLIYLIVFSVLVYGIMDIDQRYLFFEKQIFTGEIQTKLCKFSFYIYRSAKIGFAIQSVYYTYMIYRLHKQHITNVLNLFSDDEKYDLKWLRYIAYSFILTFVFNISLQIFKLNFINSHEIYIAISYLIFASFFMLLGVFTVRQRVIFEKRMFRYEMNKNVSTPLLSMDNIKVFMENEKPYLSYEFNIYDICKKFETNRTYISNMINKEYGNNFRTMVNDYRIRDAKEKIKLNLNNYFKLENIAKESGFSSYSSFLRVFKQIEGVSPTDYIKKYK